jgi:hypothetical protein
MSGGQSCKCEERSEPLTSTTNRPGRLWRVVDWRCNHSAFNGWHHTPSRYSAIMCLRCGSHWRTKAPYADTLTHLDRHTELNISYGYASHARAMEDRGRTPLR